MAKVTVNPGVCGFKTVISANSEDMQNAILEITTECPYIKAMGEELKVVDGFTECFSGFGDGEVCKAAAKHCKHPSCPVPSAVLKAVEVACRLALPSDVSFIVTND